MGSKADIAVYCMYPKSVRWIVLWMLSTEPKSPGGGWPPKRSVENLPIVPMENSWKVFWRRLPSVSNMQRLAGSKYIRDKVSVKGSTWSIALRFEWSGRRSTECLRGPCKIVVASEIPGMKRFVGETVGENWVVNCSIGGCTVCPRPHHTDGRSCGDRGDTAGCGSPVPVP